MLIINSMVNGAYIFKVGGSMDSIYVHLCACCSETPSLNKRVLRLKFGNELY